MDANTAILLAISGIFTSIGAAITEIWIKPWLKNKKKQHEKIIKKIKGKA